MVRLLLTILAASVFQISFGQTIKLEAPVEVKANVNQPLSIRVNISEIKNYTVAMQGQPQSAVLNKNVFTLNATNAEVGAYFIRFQLKDSTGTTVSESDMNLRVEMNNTTPEISFDKPLGDSIDVTEGEQYF